METFRRFWPWLAFAVLVVAGALAWRKDARGSYQRANRTAPLIDFRAVEVALDNAEGFVMRPPANDGGMSYDYYKKGAETSCRQSRMKLLKMRDHPEVYASWLDEKVEIGWTPPMQLGAYPADPIHPKTLEGKVNGAISRWQSTCGQKLGFDLEEKPGFFANLKQMIGGVFGK